MKSTGLSSLINLQTIALLFLYLVISVFLKWNFSLTIDVALFSIGLVVGTIIFPLTEWVLRPAASVQNTHSPLRSVLVQLIVVVLTFFVLSSSEQFLGKGFILALNLHLLFLQIDALQKYKNLAVWFGNLHVSEKTQRNYIYALAILFIIETLFFIFL